VISGSVHDNLPQQGYQYNIFVIEATTALLPRTIVNGV